MQFKVMTYNIQHGVDYLRSKANRPKVDLSEMNEEQLKELAKKMPRGEDPSLIDLPKMAGAIREEAPVFCALNEVRDESEDECFGPQAKILSECTDMPYHYFAKAIMVGDRGPYGNALISSWPMISAKTILIPDPEDKSVPGYYETRCVLKAILQMPDDRPLCVMVTHMGLVESEARNAVQTVLDNLEPDIPTILLGDFNLEPDSPILEPLDKVMTSATPLLPEGTCTFPSDGPTIKIDHIYLHGPIRFIRAEVPAYTYSDHRPHTAIVETYYE